MIRFECDYGEGAHPSIIKKLAETNDEQTPGYGNDVHCERARALIREACKAPEAEVQFLIGGTGTNVTVISAALRPHQGAVSADTGHINVHESGAPEATGHKVLPIPSADGKVTAKQVEALCAADRANPTRDHMVQPGMLYISQPTENGTVYSLSELTALRRICDEYGLLLYADGARLGYALGSEGCDVTLADMARLCDAFYIGGTKAGAIIGEALVIPNNALAKDIRYHIKQRCQLLAKGRLIGIQFECLFDSGLYLDITREADKKAMRLRRAFEKKGWKLMYDSPTNQQFPIVPNAQLVKLADKYTFSEWAQPDDQHTCVRFCASVFTPDASIDALIKDVEAL